MRNARRFTAVVATLLSVVLSTAAPAASITYGNTPQPDDENVLFSRPGLLASGTTLQGWTNQSQFLVDFTSTSTLNTPSHGQAKIQPNGDGSWTDLSIRLHDPAASFASLILNIDAKANGSAGITLFGPGGAVLLNQAVSLNKNGNNFLTIVAGASESFSRVLIYGSVALSDAKQFRIGGAGFEPTAVLTPIDPGPQMAVPTPAAAMSGVGLLGLYALKRRRPPGPA
jgi:hypothetical protein